MGRTALFDLRRAYLADEGTLIFAFDSGASESVIAEGHAPQLKTTISAGSQVGFVDTAANGATMPNRGEKADTFRTTEGHSCMFNWQATDIQKDWVSVS